MSNRIDPTQQDTATAERIDELVRQFTALWWESDVQPPDLGHRYTVQEQQARGELQEGFNVLPSSPAAAETVAAAAARYDMLATDLSDTLLHEP